MMRAVLCLALVILAQPAWSRGYVMSRHWPTGVFERQFDMLAQHEPLCRAVLAALNRAAGRGPFAMCRPAPLASDGVAEAAWTALHPDDAFALYLRFEKALVPNALFSVADLAGIETRLADGRLRFETAMVRGLAPLDGEVRLLRLVTRDCASVGGSDEAEIAIADDARFDTLHAIAGVFQAGSVLTFRGRSYLVAMSIETYDDSLTRRLKTPQPVVDIGETFSNFGPIAAAKVCRLRYR